MFFWIAGPGCIPAHILRLRSMVGTPSADRQVDPVAVVAMLLHLECRPCLRGYGFWDVCFVFFFLYLGYNYKYSIYCIHVPV